jgi:putative transcriptional regulator
MADPDDAVPGKLFAPTFQDDGSVLRAATRIPITPVVGGQERLQTLGGDPAVSEHRTRRHIDLHRPAPERVWRIVNAGLTVVKPFRKGYIPAMPIRWKLKEMAKRAGVTGYRLAALTGLTRQALYHLMREPVAERVDAETLAKLCAALDCQPGDLLEYRKR